MPLRRRAAAPRLHRRQPLIAAILLILLPALSLAGDVLEEVLRRSDDLASQGDHEGAARTILERLEGPGANPELAGDPRAWSALGAAARAGRDLETAASAFGKARALRPDPETSLEEAECRLEMRDDIGAEKALRSAGPIPAPLQGRAEEIQAMVLISRGREQEARPHLERARAAGSGTAAHYLGLAAFHRGEHRPAADLFALAIRANPEDYYSHLYRGWSFLELHLTDEARKALEEARAVASTPEVEQMLGRVELRAGRLEEAVRRYRAALAAQPGYPEAQFGLASALRLLGRRDESREASAAFSRIHQAQQAHQKEAYRLHQVHLARPGDAIAAEELARHHLAGGDVQGAERMAWKSLALDPGRIAARLTLARALSAMGRRAEAAFHYRRVLRASPAEAEARQELEELIRRYGRRGPVGSGR